MTALTSESRPAARPRRSVRSAEVVASERVSPNVQRITLIGDLHGIAAMAPGAYVKLFLPPEPGASVELPTFGSDGPIWPEGAVRPIVRTYTPRRYDVVSRHLEIDVVQHGDGPAARWATTTGPGERIGVGGPGRGYDPDPQASHFLLAGDETALSALLGIAAALPATASAEVLIEVPTVEDAQGFSSRAGLEVAWLPRAGAPAGSLLRSALAGLVIPTGASRVWVAGEAACVRAVRDDLLARTSLRREDVTVRGYWKRGAANHPDHDHGE